MTQPLSGILVVAIEQAVAAPFASCRLADAGARVIKIERPEGDFTRGYDGAIRGESAPITSGSTAARNRSFSTSASPKTPRFSSACFAGPTS